MKSFNIIFLFLLIPFVSFATNDNNGLKKHEKTKTIKKNFSVNSNATVFLKNKYGNLNVTTWNENKVDITVKITVKGNSLSKVEDKLDGIDVIFEASENLVEARTTIESTKSNWSFWGSNNNINYQINYYVKMPKTNNADFHNKYGNIELDEIEGKTNINCDYGKIEIDKLLNSSNTIDLDYCSASEINFMESGNVNIDYSKLKINTTTSTKVNSDYSTVRIGTSENVDFNCDYGSIVINEATNINGNSDYAGMKIGTLKKNLKISTDYGGIKILNLANGFENVTIDGSYAGIKILTNESNSFSFKMDLGYAGFSYPDDNVDLTKSIKKSTKKYYEGTFGNASSNSSINVKSRYGSVSLKVND
ncbi:conserved exported protein of unknown function [Tenacibaculum sp. 190130A14a]|uniref:Adhesin n=1 Tax=Tenacibaculum polynesiense TaxID=3137857 RepID=A0ABM9PF54_9FLAO